MFKIFISVTEHNCYQSTPGIQNTSGAAVHRFFKDPQKCIQATLTCVPALTASTSSALLTPWFCRMCYLERVNSMRHLLRCVL